MSGFFIDDDLSFSSDIGSSPKKSLAGVNTDNPVYPYIELNSYLNNSGDFVVLFAGDGSILDSYSYIDDPGLGVTIGRSPDGENWQTCTTSSKGESNNSSC